MALRMPSLPLECYYIVFFISSPQRPFRIGIHRVNGHRHWFHFVPAIGQGVECERIDTGLLVLNLRVIFPAHEMVIFRRQELIILFRHPFRRLNVDPHGSRQRGCLPTSVLPSSFAVDTPSATRDCISDDAVSTAFLSSATNLDSAVFVDT